VARWDVVFEVEGVEERRLSGVLTSHHRCEFRWIDGKSVDQLQQPTSTEFFNGIDPKRSFVGTSDPDVFERHEGGTGHRPGWLTLEDRAKAKVKNDGI
jgi:hypothetical protein